MEHSEIIGVRKKKAEWTKNQKNESPDEIKNGNDAGELLKVEECNKEENAESSDSDAETEPARSFHRKLSTNKEIKDPISCTREGYLMKQTWTFQRWKRRYFKLKGRTLYYAKNNEAAVFDEIDLADLKFVECNIKSAAHTFQVITPFRSLVLCGENRQDMEDWIGALKTASESRPSTDAGTAELLGGNHQWYATSHARPTYCNVCRDALIGVTSHGLSCEICKYKVHKRCSAKAINNCKWTTLASIGKDIIEDKDGNISMPHQWMEGNLPVSSKCSICDKTCGSVLRLQDWRCLWCRATVHTACRPAMSDRCPLGPGKLSVVPPTALHSIGSDEAWEAVRPIGCSPLLVFVNSKSGDNQGIKFLRRFKQILNPAQVFDLIKGGPGPGLRLFRHFDPFRILVCSGDGSVGWVLSEIDRLGMHKQCQVGVLPLGTGNDLARVLGWGASCDDDTHLPQLLEKYEKASTKMLDRWSVMTFERSISLPCRKLSMNQTDLPLSSALVQEYEDSVLSHITNILQSNQDNLIISNAKILCETVKDFTARVIDISFNSGDQQLAEKCDIVQQKLNSLIKILHIDDNDYQDIEDDREFSNFRAENIPSLDHQEKGVLEKPEKDITNLKRVRKRKDFMDKDALLSRADSLKRAIRSFAELTELSSEEQSMKRNLMSYDKKANLDLPLVATLHSISSTDSSLCSSPTPNVASLSPMPDLRRDSQADEMLTLPAPDGFADSRRNSSNMPQVAFSFEAPMVEKALLTELKKIQNEIMTNGDEFQIETQSDIQVTVTPTTLDTSSPTDDTTIQDAMISPDSETAFSKNASLENMHRMQSDVKIDPIKGSCSNSIISLDSTVSDTMDSKSLNVKNSESEIGHIDSDILDSTKQSDSPEIGHIDSAENSEIYETQSESMIDDLSSLGQDLISTIMGEKYDSVRECLESENVEKPAKKYCSLAQFAEGSDIARRSFKKPSRNIKIDQEMLFGGKNLEFPSNILKINSNENEKNDKHSQSGEKITNLLSPVCCFTVSSDQNVTNESQQIFPPTISVIVDPPSPSASIGSRHEKENKLNSKLRRLSGESMEKLNVELPEYGCSPQATRRISSGSLLKPNEVVSLAASAARLGGSSLSLRHERAKSVDKTEEVKKLPIINPLVRLPMWPNVSGGAGLISQALLANADALCAAVSPLMDPDETLMEGYFERCVMNNYFGIGIDAKISLDFHHKREEHPEKCRSRAKNYMWYGVLGSKQWLQKTYKNLDQRVQLECDGQRIPLPSLQGIVVLNIPSFMGGTNFWGGTKEGDIFLAPSFDDRILEVVAVFGSVQMAASRLINLQHHRIAQCHSVQINILGDEGVPIQVDGEAWIQPPGIIRIIHKNRMQMLFRNRALETSLRAWEEKQQKVSAVSQSSSTLSSTTSQSRTHLQIDGKQLLLTDEEMSILLGFIEVVTTLVKWVKLLIISHPSLEPDLYQIAARTAVALEKVHPDGKILQGTNLRPVVTDLVSTARQLYEESCELLRDKAHNLKLREDLENKLSLSLATMEQELRKCIFDEGGTCLVYLQHLPPEDQSDKKNRHRGLFWLKFRRSIGNAGNHPARDQVTHWGVQEVCCWLENLQLGEYVDNFVSHDIRGRELLSLARRDLKELGITKVGHVKRILQAINDLNS
ncbi:diacylglycerol kinase eta isoform X4 [Leptopilina boulardi]|uniref:diacylglycerol kinase eta isoform X4 n=1 Tax=Leptopilina boulardi TaxID=63433 RepID=UPI0021F60B2A|nr:diacylglycerol kinase eta isoform X4 [Leptopilina boulardi]